MGCPPLETASTAASLHEGQPFFVEALMYMRCKVSQRRECQHERRGKGDSLLLVYQQQQAVPRWAHMATRWLEDCSGFQSRHSSLVAVEGSGHRSLGAVAVDVVCSVVLTGHSSVDSMIRTRTRAPMGIGGR